jgi:hypothetical protein
VVKARRQPGAEAVRDADEDTEKARPAKGNADGSKRKRRVDDE